jgi:hypothetical protein
MAYGETPEEIAASAEERRKDVRLGIKIAVGALVFTLLIIWAWKYATPKYNLYRAETEKRAVIAEQRAQSEAAEFAAISEVTQAQARADAEVIRATGLAEAQAIISETLTEDYIRYLYIQAIEGNPNQIIYIPTEAGLPVLEAGRFGVPAPTE